MLYTNTKISSVIKKAYNLEWITELKSLFIVGNAHSLSL